MATTFINNPLHGLHLLISEKVPKWNLEDSYKKNEQLNEHPLQSSKVYHKETEGE